MSQLDIYTLYLYKKLENIRSYFFKSNIRRKSNIRSLIKNKKKLRIFFFVIEYSRSRIFDHEYSNISSSKPSMNQINNFYEELYKIK